MRPDHRRPATQASGYGSSSTERHWRARKHDNSERGLRALRVSAVLVRLVGPDPCERGERVLGDLGPGDLLRVTARPATGVQARHRTGSVWRPERRRPHPARLKDSFGGVDAPSGQLWRGLGGRRRRSSSPELQVPDGWVEPFARLADEHNFQIKDVHLAAAEVRALIALIDSVS